ncbi:MAG: sugar dehydrogenase complex small subunit [Casimicrobiaceae bacterium]
MSIRFSSKRRRILVGLAGALPAVQLLRPSGVLAAQNDDVFLRVSRIITGTDALSADVAGRIRDLLTARDDKFASKLGDLADALQKTSGNRVDMLSRLSNGQVAFALAIAKPWYLGYVGTPSNFVMKDDAAFATFLEAQSYQKIIDFVPRPTYPSGSAGSWDAAPKGVDSPAMPDQIKDWTFHPGGPSTIMAPDPQWKLYATTKYASVEEARKKKPQAANSPGRG